MHKKTLKRGRTCLYPLLSPNVAAYWFIPLLFNVLFHTCVFNSPAHSSIHFLSPCPSSHVLHVQVFLWIFSRPVLSAVPFMLSSMKSLHLFFSSHLTPMSYNIYLVDVPHASVFHLLSDSLLCPLSGFTPFPTLYSCLSFPILYSFLNYMQSSHGYIP